MSFAELKEVAEDTNKERDVRKDAIYTLFRNLGDEANATLEKIAGDEAESLDIRQQARKSLEHSK